MTISPQRPGGASPSGPLSPERLDELIEFYSQGEWIRDPQHLELIDRETAQVLRAYRDAREWRPIETAPIDHPILVLARDLCGRSAVYCVTRYKGTRYDGSQYEGCSVVGCGCQEGGTDFDEPTHWRPLPAPYASCDTAATAAYIEGKDQP